MSDDHLKRLVRRTRENIPAALDAGTEKDLLFQYFREISYDAAEYVFTASNGLVDSDTEDFVESFAFDVVQLIDNGFRNFNLHYDRFVLEAQAIATRAYYDRLSELAAHSTTGGCA